MYWYGASVCVDRFSKYIAIAIVDEIERLCNLKGAEFREWHSKVREIAQYNYRVLQGRNYLIKPMN